MQVAANTAGLSMSPLQADFNNSMSYIAGFEHKPVIAVAVSGGADSLALLLLTHAWAQQCDATVVALTVDHGLRAESASEAKYVAQLSDSLNIAHHITSVTLPENANQEDARDERYQALEQYCNTHGILHLLTGHHMNDQAETMLLRTGRGSGLHGLSAMAAVQNLRFVRLLRPLLGIKKSSLETYLHDLDMRWVEDPSNNNSDYLRTRIRALLSDEQVTRATNIAHYFGAFRKTNQQHAMHLAQHVTLHPAGYAHIDYNAFLKLPIYERTRLVSQLIQTISGAPYSARSHALDRAATTLSNLSNDTEYCVGGVSFYHTHDDTLLIYREPNAVAPAVQVTTETCWDTRFKVSTNQPITVKALGHVARNQLKDGGALKNIHIPWRILPVIPSVWHLEELLYVPHISYRNSKFADLECFVRFEPRKPLADRAFLGLNT